MKPNRARFALSLALKTAIVVCACIGLGLSIFGQDGFMTGNAFLYFTNLSNLWIGLVALAFAVQQIVGRVRGRDCIPNWLRVTKFVFTVSITLTFVVFAVLLAPTIGWEYMSSLSNLCLHFIVPILAIADFVLFDTDWRHGRFTFLYATIPPLCYFAATILMSMGGVRYHNGDIVPYYFLNYERLGWFAISANGIGVFYWVLVMVAIVSGTGLILLKVNDLRRAKLEKRAKPTDQAC